MDGNVDISDPIAILRFLFQGDGSLPCPDAADANDDGRYDISDPITILNRLFAGGSALPEPGNPGQDPTADDIVCEPVF